MALVGVPAAAVAAMSKGPGWAAMARLAPTLAHDSAVLDHRNGAPVPVAVVGRIAAPVLALAGAASPAVLRQSAERIASAARQGTFRLLPGQTHDVAPEALAPALADFFAA